MPKRIAIAAIACGCAAPAAAHSTIEGVNDFLAGALHVMTAPEHVLAIVALALLAAQKGWEQIGASALVFPAAFLLAAVAGATFLFTVRMTGAAEFSVIALGIWVALARPAPARVFFVLLIAIGVIHGAANGAARLPQMSVLSFVGGASFAALVILAIVVMPADWLLRKSWHWPPVAVRALGSWIAAIGVLSLALGMKSIS